MAKVLKYSGMALTALCCLVFCVTALITLNCLADKKENCAQQSGFIALVTGCFASVMLGLGMWQVNKGT